MSPDGRILLLVIAVLIGVAVGRHFQRMLDAWRDWKGTLARIPILEATAKAKVRGMIWVVLATLLFLWAFANLENHL